MSSGQMIELSCNGNLHVSIDVPKVLLIYIVRRYSSREAAI